MSAFLEVFDLSAPPVAFLVSLAARGLLVLAGAGVVSLLLRRKSAAARHLAWCLAAVGLLVLPAASAVLPAWTILLPAAPPAPAAGNGSGGPHESPAAGANSRPGPGAAAMAGPSEVRPGDGRLPVELLVLTPDETDELDLPAAPPAWVWVLAAWLTGVIVGSLPVVLGHVALRRLRREVRPFGPGPLTDLSRRLAAGLGIRRPVTVLEGPVRCMPMTWGAWRPVVLLPAEAVAWPVDRLRVVLLHELAHVRRRDGLTQTLATLARALHWFNPLAWLAVARLRAEQERACDDAVLRAGTDPADYAEQLLSVLADVPSRLVASPAALAFGRMGRQENRMRAILDRARDRRPLTSRRTALAALTVAGVLLPLAALTLETGPAEARPVAQAEKPAATQPAPDPGNLAAIRALVEKEYVKAVAAAELNKGAIRGMLQALGDPHSDYLPPDELKGMENQLAGSLTGIGAQLMVRDGAVAVVTPLEDSPALAAGLKAGDVLTAVDGQPTRGRALSEVVRQILGRPGTPVKLTLTRDGETRELEVTRAPVKLRTVKGFRRDGAGKWEYWLDPDRRLAYVQVTHFTPATAHELTDAVRSLGDPGPAGLVVDLRGCPGGMFSAATDVVNLFQKDGTIVTTRGRGQADKAWAADGKAPFTGVPLAVLVDGHTASAAEIVAGALKDHGRATVLGTRTQGKGSIQELVKLEGDGGAVKLTVSTYHLPSGRAIDRRPGEKDWGVDPSEGQYLPLDARQEEALWRMWRDRDVLGKRPDPAQPKLVLTPDALATHYADPQLGAVLKGMIARAETGTFPQVGQSQAALQAHLARREEIRQRQDKLRQDLAQADKDLADVERTIRENK